ncbi:unnamed protein product [Aphanomyces euteiches]|nr:hypothetical protein AeRB84_005861 [Aphanomyces euteiches]
MYASYKFYAMANFASVSSTDLLITALADSHVISAYPEIVMLLQITLTLPHGSVDCERAFSLQNLIKNKFRNQLSIEHLEDLMICAHDSPDVQNFNAHDMTEAWLNAKKRKLEQLM